MRCNVQVSLARITCRIPNTRGQNPGRVSQSCVDGLRKRFLRLIHAFGRICAVEDYQARLEFELNVINQMGFAGYFDRYGVHRLGQGQRHTRGAGEVRRWVWWHTP